MKSPVFAAAIATVAIALAAPAHADNPDIDFAQQLHSDGIYGPRDYNAWLGKITCERLDKGVDGDAFKSVRFLTPNLDKGLSATQVWRFLGASIMTYCPDKRYFLEQASAR